MFYFRPTAFRCFYRSRHVRIAPITILLGENSTGKTSFLAGLRVMLDLISTAEEPNFNKPPFSLGAFEQIAHYRGGSYGRAKQFSFDIARPARSELIEQARNTYPDYEISDDERLELVATFSSKNGQPILSQMGITFGPVSLEINLRDNDRVRVETPRIKLTYTQNEALRKARLKFATANDLRFLPMAIRNLLGESVIYDDGKFVTQPSRMAPDELELLSRISGEALGALRRQDLKIFGPIRMKPERTYDPQAEIADPEGQHVPYLLARLKSEKGAAWQNLKARLEKFGKASGLFEQIEVRRKGKADSDPFQLVFKIRALMANLIDVGYGVSQILPLLTELIISSRPTIHLMQQPEVHLHPRAQAEFASLVKEIFSGSSSYCIMETHSDFIVDRLRYHLSQSDGLRKEDISLIFFSRQKSEVMPVQLELDDLGNILTAPRGYREFFKRERFRALGLENVPNS